MARIRSIKPEFFSDDDVAALPPLVRLLFIGMWTEADKAGRLKDKPKTLKARCLPFDNINMTSALKQLVDAHFIIRYTVEDCGYIQIRTWEEHQRPHHTERESTYPECVERSLTVKPPLDNGETTCETKVRQRMRQNHEPSSSFLSFPFPSSLGEEPFRGVWASWVRHRQQIKKPLTEEQVKKQIAKFADWGQERAIAAINHTIEKGWQGIREPEPTAESKNGQADYQATLKAKRAKRRAQDESK